MDILHHVRRADGRVVGHVIGNELRKKVRQSIHQLLIPPSWACDVFILEEATSLGALCVVLYEEEHGLVWRAPISLFWSKGIPMNRGHGDQLALPLEYWEVEGGGGGIQLPLFAR